jgi:hypothetical protein
MYGGGARELACCWPRDATPFLSCVRHTVRRISVDAAGLYELGLFPPGRKEKKKNNSRVPRSETWPPPNEAESKKMTAHARLRPGEKRKTGEREEEDGRKRSNKRTNVSTIKNKKRDKLSSSSSSFNVLVKSLSG